MGIRFRCPQCGKKIHVKDFLAGKRGICPRCDSGIDIPTTSQLPPSKKRKSPPRPPGDENEVEAEHAGLSARKPAGRLLGTSEFPSVDPLVEAPDRRWFVGSPDGREVGPLATSEVRELIDFGDVRAETPVRREDWPERLVAAAVWPHWKGTDPFAPQTPRSDREPPLSVPTHLAASAVPTSAPTAAPAPAMAAGLPPPTATIDPSALRLPPTVGGPNTLEPGVALPPSQRFVPMPPTAVSPDDSAAPEPELYYVRGTNPFYFIAIGVVLAVVVAAIAYWVAFDPPA